MNFEIAALVIDDDSARQVEDMFEKDLASSRQMVPNEFDDKPLWFRMAVRAARLAAPLL